VSVVDLMRTQAAALRVIADEVGQIPARMTVAHTGGVDIRINGMDLADPTCGCPVVAADRQYATRPAF